MILQLAIIFTVIYSVIQIKSLIILIGIILILSILMIILSFRIYKKSISIGTNHLTGKEINTEIEKRINKDKISKVGPKIVMIGGGSGLSNILKGIKKYTSNITAIVTTFDDGGSTGKLRKQLDVVAPGDIRKCITALSNSESCMDDLLKYRFKDENVDNHSLGNLFLVAMTDIMGSFPLAIKKISDIFNVEGTVLPVSLDKITLCADFANGTTAEGEENIPEVGVGTTIKKLYLKQKTALPAPGVLEAIKEADIIILGPGSLYTSVICNLLVEDVAEEIKEAKAKKIYIANLMTQKGETDNFELSNHVNEIEKYLGKNILDYVVANNEEITEETLELAGQKDSKPVTIDDEDINNKNIKLIENNYVNTKPGMLLHNSKLIASDIIETINKI